jgi:phosphoglycolate phosphatase-like HAD superfamily hydrolase
MVRVRPTVLLFDIDGTLISTDGVGRRAFERAIARRTGLRDTCGFSFAGMTDRAIARAGIEAAGRTATEAEIDATIAAYVELLAGEIGAAACRIHAGVVAAIEAAAGAGAAIGLGTGNVREGARLKLGRAGLFERFAFGGFGCDHEQREEILRIGAARGAAALGAPAEACRVVVIGDTPRDIAAAHAIGAECVAVATGSYGIEALAACAPTRVFADLAADGALAAVIG